MAACAESSGVNAHIMPEEKTMATSESSSKKWSKFYFSKTVQEFKDTLREHEFKTNTRYAFRCGPNSFTKKLMTFNTKARLHWHDKTPYFHFGTRFYNCHQGKDNNIYQKKKYAQQREAKIKLNNGGEVRCHVNRRTKKVGCPAAVNVTRVYFMPKYKLTTKFNHKAKTKVSLAIKDSLSKGILVEGEELYRFNLPDPSEHKNHIVGEKTNFSKTLDPRLLKKISAYVQEGKTNPTAIYKQLEQYVAMELLETDKTKAQFYPNVQTVKNAVSIAKRALCSSKIDLSATQQMVERWHIPSENLFFVCNTDASQLSVEAEGRNLNSKPLECGSSLLFVYQNDSMRHLYQRYGSDTLLLDPVYRMYNLNISVYFLVVKTNVGRAVVGVIILHPENKVLLIRGLSIFQGWNMHVKPRYALVDMSKDEIEAMETTFPELSVFICSFHRERAWGKWASKIASEGDAALVFLHQIRNSTTEGHLQQALQELQSMPFYATSSLKSYFEQSWLNELRRWVIAYKPEGMLFNVDGEECFLDEQLGYSQLQSLKNCSLSKLITNLVDRYLPESYRMYVRKNLQMINENNRDLPTYLHHRPNWLINCLKVVCSTAAQLHDEITCIGNNSFTVHPTASQAAKDIVRFDPDKGFCCCTCYDFVLRGFMCHHIAAVGARYFEWSLSSIHVWLFRNPIFTYDDTVALLLPLEMLDVNYASNTGQTGVTTKNVSQKLVDKDYKDYKDVPKQAKDKLKPSVDRKKIFVTYARMSMQCIKDALESMDVKTLSELTRRLEELQELLPILKMHSKFDPVSGRLKQRKIPTAPPAVENVTEVMSSPDIVNVISLQNLQPDLYANEVVISNVLFDYECDEPLPQVGAVATVESM